MHAQQKIDAGLSSTVSTMRSSTLTATIAVSMLAIGCFFSAADDLSAQEPDRISILSQADIESWGQDAQKGEWKERVFNGQTIYEAVNTPDGPALQATSRGTASVLYREIRIDLEKTPYLHWDWQIEKSIAGFDERTKEGDDYSARIYVVRSHPILRWKTKAVNYVWAGSQAQGQTWPSAYTDASHNMALQSGDTEAGQWVSEWRDVRADFQSLLGEDFRYIDGVAIMTDTDNTGGEATAWYRNVFFSSEPGDTK
ncbi:MAG: DUF3047 domain-containing protein [Ectothiorhodospiraceae bacterium AqS1]|nr:DUF3047 domain-containing protein [Ectothiorhodospiraceae bacterium AqS1]